MQQIAVKYLFCEHLGACDNRSGCHMLREKAEALADKSAQAKFCKWDCNL